MSDSKIGASKSIYYSLTDDVPDLTDTEREKLEAVMKKALEFEEEEANKMRQPVEGQLYKYTNVVKGWQYRWFILTPDTGMLEYYMLDEKKKSRPRGALDLSGGVVVPSEEDNQSFTVSAVSGEVFKLKASDAKERQLWVDRIRLVIEKCTTERPMVSDSIQPSFALCKTVSSSTFHIADDNALENPSHASSEKNLSTLPNAAPAKSLQSLNEIKEAVDKAVVCQKTLAKSIEDLPLSGPSIKCTDPKLLLLKATSQATVQSLEECFLILRRHKQGDILKSSLPKVLSSKEPVDKTKSNVKKPG